ncbi:MAG: tetratricopeptide repeat protein [bacterium]
MPHYITIPLIIISLIVVVIIVFRKFSILARIDVDNIESEKQRLVKKKIINDKFKRNLNKFGQRSLKIIKPIVRLIGKIFVGIYNKLIAVKDNYSQTNVRSDKPDNQAMSKLFAEARDFANKEDLMAAENKYIEIIGLDSSSVQAFQELGEIYLAKENYEDAEQTFQHVVKLRTSNTESKSSDLAKVYFYLSLVYRGMSENNKAKDNLIKALEIEPGNPRYLDKMIDLNIIIKNKDDAWQAFQKLQSTNPDNNKLEDFKQRISEL